MIPRKTYIPNLKLMLFIITLMDSKNTVAEYIASKDRYKTLNTSFASERTKPNVNKRAKRDGIKYTIPKEAPRNFL